MQWSERIGRRIKLRDLHILLAVAQHGSMGKAARQLGMSQPVVSKAIAELERALRLRLLDRSPQGIEPTAYGRALLKSSATVFDDLRQGVKTLEFLADPRAGELRIGTTEPGAAGFVPEVIDRFSRKYPRVRFHVTTADPVTLSERQLAQREIELAIGAAPGAEVPRDVVAEHLFEDRAVVMAAARSKWSRRRRLALADLLDEPWILPPPESAFGVHIAQAFRDSGLQPPQAAVVAFSIPLIQHLLARGRYLSMLPVVMARLGKHFSLTAVDVKFAGVPRSVSIMTLRNRELSPLAHVFMGFVRETARRLAPT
jgi:DNA-binding transcriptional LysR family regulator